MTPLREYGMLALPVAGERGESMAGAGADLGTEGIRRLLLRLALPTIASQAVNMLYNLVDRIYIGHIPGIGTRALTGVGTLAAMRRRPKRRSSRPAKRAN